MPQPINQDYLRKSRACLGGRRWLQSFDSYEEAWEKCECPNWLLWACLHTPTNPLEKCVQTIIHCLRQEVLPLYAPTKQGLELLNEVWPLLETWCATPSLAHAQACQQFVLDKNPDLVKFLGWSIRQEVYYLCDCLTPENSANYRDRLSSLSESVNTEGFADDVARRLCNIIRERLVCPITNE